MHMRVNPRQIIQTALFFTMLSATLAVVVVYRHVLWEAVLLTRPISFLIASDPSGADAILDGKPVGKTPLTLPIEIGRHVIVLQKEGFQETSRAFLANVYSPRWPEAVHELNIELTKHDVPSRVRPLTATTPPNSVPSKPGMDSSVFKELRELRSIILANPEESVTVVVLQERMRLQNEEIKGLRDDLKEVKEQSRWVVGLIVSVVVALLTAVGGVVLQTFPKNNKA